MSAYIGKRYTILATMIFFMAICIWNVYITDFKSFKIARILGGIGLGVVEALGPPIIGECFPKHQLGTAMAIYSLSLGAGAAVGPVIGGLVFQLSGNWPWFFKFSAMLLAANIVGIIFMLPETASEVSREWDGSASPTTKDPSNEMMVVTVEDVKSTPVLHESPASIDLEQTRSIWIKRSFYFKNPDNSSDKNLLRLFLRPLYLLLAPAVILTSIVFGVMISYTININIIFSQYFEGPPKFWSPLNFGLLNMCTMIGLILGIPLGGALPDYLYRRSLRRNAFPKPECRLPSFIPGCFISPFGVMLVGIALKNNYHWVVMALGWLLLMTGLTGTANILLTYAVDCYPENAIHIGVIMNVTKNMVAFALSYIAIPWYSSAGPLKMFGTMAGILFAMNLFTIPLYIFGPRLREASLKYII